MRRAVHPLEGNVQSLASTDERLKLLAPTLATYVTQLRKNTSSDPVFNELCNSLSADLPDPFLRSIFAFLASGQVSDILDEEALPLRDRMGVALRFLRDDEVCCLFHFWEQWT